MIMPRTLAAVVKLVMKILVGAAMTTKRAEVCSAQTVLNHTSAATIGPCLLNEGIAHTIAQKRPCVGNTPPDMKKLLLLPVIKGCEFPLIRLAFKGGNFSRRVFHKVCKVCNDSFEVLPLFLSLLVQLS